MSVFCCPEHAPIGVDAQPFDDGLGTCCVCGKTNYAVKPFQLSTAVVERGWRAANYEIVSAQ